MYIYVCEVLCLVADHAHYRQTDRRKRDLNSEAFTTLKIKRQSYFRSEGEDLEYALDGKEHSESHVEIAERVRVDDVRLTRLVRVKLFLHTNVHGFMQSTRCRKTTRRNYF